MDMLKIVLIVIVGVLLLGPLMWIFAKLNGVNPFVFDEGGDDDMKSMIIVSALRPLFVPLWIEKKLFDKIFRKDG